MRNDLSKVIPAANTQKIPSGDKAGKNNVLKNFQQYEILTDSNQSVIV